MTPNSSLLLLAGDRGFKLLVTLDEAIDFAAPRLNELKREYEDSIKRLLGTTRHPGIEASVESVDKTIEQVLVKIKECYGSYFSVWINYRKVKIEKDIHFAMNDIQSSDEGYSEDDLQTNLDLVLKNMERSLGLGRYVSREELSEIVTPLKSPLQQQQGQNTAAAVRHSPSLNNSSSKRKLLSFISTSALNTNANAAENITNGVFVMKDYRQEFKIVYDGLMDIYNSYLELILVENTKKANKNKLAVDKYLLDILPQVEESILKFAYNGINSAGQTVGTLRLSKNPGQGQGTAAVSSKQGPLRSTPIEVTTETIPNYTLQDLYSEYDRIYNKMYVQLKKVSKDSPVSNTVLKEYESRCEYQIKNKLIEYYSSIRMLNIHYVICQQKKSLKDELSVFYSEANNNKRNVYLVEEAMYKIYERLLFQCYEYLKPWTLSWSETTDSVKTPFNEYYTLLKTQCIDYISQTRHDRFIALSSSTTARWLAYFTSTPLTNNNSSHSPSQSTPSSPSTKKPTSVRK